MKNNICEAANIVLSTCRWTATYRIAKDDGEIDWNDFEFLSADCNIGDCRIDAGEDYGLFAPIDADEIIEYCIVNGGGKMTDFNHEIIAEDEESVTIKIEFDASDFDVENVSLAILQIESGDINELRETLCDCGIAVC